MLYFSARDVEIIPVTIVMDPEFFPLPRLPRQDEFIRALVAGLAALDQTHAVWLTGSLARGDADRWSTVDIHLRWRQDRHGQDCQTKPFRTVKKCIGETLGEENVLIDQVNDSDSGGSLQGICLGTQSALETLNESGPAGLLFQLTWTMSTDTSELAGPDGATQLLYISKQEAGACRAAPDRKRGSIAPPDIETIDRQLTRFWLLLARLPAVVGRQEQLAAHLLLTELGTLLIDLVVSLNGGSRPQTRARINQYLGPAQREAFEKSLGLRNSGRQSDVGNSANWTGQAVALVVLYRWYAPQLAQKYSLTYPRPAEDSVLAYLADELKNWPASITTG